MEKENLTKEELVGSPAPKNVKDVDHNFTSPTKNELSDDEMVDAANAHDEDDSTYNSSFSSPLRLSSSENSINTPTRESDVHKDDHEKDNPINDISDIEIRGHEEDNSSYSSLFSSPVRLSNSENPINSPTDVHKEDQEKGNFANDTSDTKIRGQEEDNSAYNSSFSSPDRLSNSDNSINAFADVPDILKEGQEKGNSVNDTTLISTANEMEIRGPEEDNSTDISSSSSPVGLSNSENSINAFADEPDILKEGQEKGNSVNDTTLISTANEMEIRGPEDDNSTDISSSSSPVGLSNSLNSINAVSGEQNIQKEDNENSNYVNNETFNSTVNETEIRGSEEGNSTAFSSSSSPVGLSNSLNSINAVFDEPDFQKEDNENGNSVNDETLSSTANDMGIIVPREGNSTDISSSSSPVGLSNSLNSVNVISGEPDIQKEDNMNCNSVNDATVNSRTNDIEIRGQEEGNSTDNSSSSSPVLVSTSENSINAVSGEQNIQKEDNENSNYVNNETFNSTVNETEIRGSEEGNSTAFSSSSSPVGLSNSLNSINAVFGEPDFQKEDNENGNSVNDETLSSTANDMEIIVPREGNSTDISSSSSPVVLSNSLNSVNVISGEPDIQKEDNMNCNSVNDATVNSTTNDIEIRGQEEGNSTDNSSSSSPVLVSTSENLINGLSHEPDVQKKVHEKGNIVNYTAEHGKIVDCVKDIDDREQSSETIIVNHQSTENVEMKSKDGDLNDQEGISVNSSFEETETGDIKTDSKENTCNKEKRLVLYGSREPNTAALPGKASVLTKFLKFKSLYKVSNIFRRLSSEKESQEVKPGWSPLSLIRISDENSQEDKTDLKEVAFESPELKAIKGRIVLYTKLWCKDCKEVRIFLRNKKLRYSEINIDVYPSRKTELEEITGSLHVPKVLFNQVLIGGVNELKVLDESGQLEEKIEFVTSEEPSAKSPLPPFSGEDDVSSKGIVDELAVIVRKMKESVVVKDRFYKFRRVTNCFLGSEAVDFLSEDQFLEREEAIEFGRKLAKELFFRHALQENIFEDGNHPYRFLDQDPVLSQCQNIPRGIIQFKRQPLVELSHRLRFLLYAILDAYTSEDGRHIAYRTIHGSEEFARYLRIAEELQRLDLNRTAKEERLAFFINLYNLMAIHAILVWGHPDGALDRRKLLNDFKYVIGGCAYSLSDIYNGILRSNQRPPYTLIKPFGITDKRFKVSLPYPEPLIHFALVFGNRSAPALRCYSPKNIDRELMKAARDFLQSGAFVLDIDSMTISVTKILKWYSVDFGRNEVEVLKHAANYLEVEKTQTLLELLHSTQLKVVYQPYDWRLNS